MRLYFNLFTIALALSLVGCGAKPISDSDQKDIKLALNWFPEAEHGGYFAAEVEGHFKGHKLSVEIQSGGPDAPVIQKVATGQAHYGIANADDVLNGRAAGAPIVAVFAPIDINPRCIMAHSSANLQSIGDIKNMTLAMSARPSFSHWLKSNYAFEGVSIVPYPAYRLVHFLSLRVFIFAISALYSRHAKPYAPSATANFAFSRPIMTLTLGAGRSASDLSLGNGGNSGNDKALFSIALGSGKTLG